MTTLITSQDFLDEAIIAAKRAHADYVVSVSPEFGVGGHTYRVVLDGHHSLAAAVADGVLPEIREMTATDHDAVGLLDGGDIDGFLAVVHMGSDYRDAITGADAF